MQNTISQLVETLVSDCGGAENIRRALDRLLELHPDDVSAFVRHAAQHDIGARHLLVAAYLGFAMAAKIAEERQAVA